MRSTRAKRWIFSGAVTLALGFGAAQAFASPAKAPGTARFCDDSACNLECLSDGFLGGGECVPLTRGGEACFCYF